MCRTVDLTPFAGKTVNHFWITADAGTPVGSWNIYYGEIAIVHSDGTVTTIYNRAPSESFSYFTGGGETNTSAIVSRSSTANDAESAEVSTTYYLADQIGSTRMTLAAGGWPITQSTYYPYGVEPTPSASPDRYKFSGKERDPASGLDNFGARYYSAVMGRFMTPDWSASPEPVPYAKLDNPQTLNLYSYVQNNPLTGIDADGHGNCDVGSGPGVNTTDESEIKPKKDVCPGKKEETEKLTDAQNKARSDPGLQPTKNGTTFCNIATCRIAKAMDAPMGALTNSKNGQPALANRIAANLAKPGSGYKEVSPEKAQELADQGKLVIAVQPHHGHGHIATVRPGGSEKDPRINNIGKHVDIRPASRAFYSNPPVKYYTPE